MITKSYASELRAGILDGRQNLPRPWENQWPKSGPYWAAYMRTNKRNAMSSEDRIAGLIEALEIVKNIQQGYELKALGTTHYKHRQQAEDRANGADDCRLSILSRIDTIRHDND